MTPGDFEACARQLKADGYTGGVVARKLISQHRMGEPAAVELVSRLYGQSVNPGGGESIGPILTGVGLIAVGVVGFGLQFVVGYVHVGLSVVLLGVAGGGVAQTLKALINVGSKPPL